MWLALAIIAVSLLYWFLSKNLGYWKSKGVLHEKPLPFFGNFKNVLFGRESVASLMNKVYKKYPGAPYFGLYILQTPNLVIFDPEFIKQVLVKDFNSFVNRQIYVDEKIDPIGHHLMTVAKNQIWKSLRAKLSPVFTSGKLKLMLPLMQDISNSLKIYLGKKSGHVINVYDIMKNYSNDVISSCAFGIEANSIKHENSEIMRMSMKITDLSKFSRALAISSYFFMPIFVKLFKFRFIPKEPADFFTNIFQATYYERKKLGIKRNDLIDLLQNLKDQEKENDEYKFDDIKMTAQALLFFVAGNDTTASILSFALYELAVNTDVQEKLRKELQENFDENNQYTYELLLDMPYLDNVIQETLRKYPFLPTLNREALEDYTFEETGLKIEKGTPILIPVSALHFDPKYFPDPEKFDPERFSTVEKRNAMQYVFLPFGNGPRKCIGGCFSMMTLKTALSTIVKDFKLSLTEKTDVPLKMCITSLFLQPINYSIPLKIEKI